jgi:hypothetical protein
VPSVPSFLHPPLAAGLGLALVLLTTPRTVAWFLN